LFLIVFLLKSSLTMHMSLLLKMAGSLFIMQLLCVGEMFFDLNGMSSFTPFFTGNITSVSLVSLLNSPSEQKIFFEQKKTDEISSFLILFDKNENSSGVLSCVNFIMSGWVFTEPPYNLYA
ncbi:hypothetical protein QZQ38_26075, partial [Serratia marcescens]|uniref:hypothetical protein n=4 Tax=Serratia marcescens TaxID=615 RepID=UPI002794F11C